MMTILLTGGAGFIGSNLVIHLITKYTEYRIINLDKLTYAGDMQNLAPVADNSRHIFTKGDICDRSFVNSLFAKYDIRGVIHLAAESHVDNSIAGPQAFIETNVLGTFHLLDAARQYWMDSPFQYKSDFNNCRFHHISTDEVYGTLGETGYFTEKTPYAPNSPYSASKAGSDMVVRSYHHTYGMNTVITNCSNNYGPRQHKEKLIPTIIRKALAGENIPIYGDGKNVRDWLFVEDHCSALDLVYHKGQSGEVYNIGGDCENTNIEIANLICNILDKSKPRDDQKSYKEQITYVTDRPGHDRRYAIDASKIKNELEWNPETSFSEGIARTIDWYLQSN